MNQIKFTGSESISAQPLRTPGSAKCTANQLTALFGRRNQRIQSSQQRAKTGLDHAPDDAVIHVCVPVNQYIAKRHDPRKIRKSSRNCRVQTGKLIERFTNDLKLALHTGPQQLVGHVLGKSFANDESRDSLPSLLRIPQQFGAIRMHRVSCVRQQRVAEKMGWIDCLESLGRQVDQTTPPARP